LRRRLRVLGLDVTQATISRDIKELGLVKRASDGAYRRAGADAASPEAAATTLQRAVVEYLGRVDTAQQLVVLRTGPGQAQPLGLAIDRATLAEVVGTIAGDDTVLVIARSARAAAALARRFARMSEE